MTVFYLTAPAGLTLPEALDWYDEHPSYSVPPLDATGDPDADTWLSAVFASLRHPMFDGMTPKVKHLLTLARHTEMVVRVTSSTAEAATYTRIAKVIGKWIEDLNAAPVVVEMGGSAA